MISDHRGRGQNKSAVARPINVSNPRTKFGWISSNGLGGDAANKIHLSHVNASMAKIEMRDPKCNSAKCYIMCTFHDGKSTQETAGSGLNRLYNVLCSL